MVGTKPLTDKQRSILEDILVCGRIELSIASSSDYLTAASCALEMIARGELNYDADIYVREPAS